MRGSWSRARGVGLVLLAACSSAPSKWNDVGVTDPIEIRMMDEWERRGLGLDAFLHEWAIKYSPNRRFAVIYRLYKERFDRPPRTEQSTYTYFRIDGDRPVFVRHEAWPDMCYDALGDDGSAVILQFNCASLRWIAIDPSGQRQSGMMLTSHGDIQASADGSFLLKAGLADYRIRIGSGVPLITRERFYEDPHFRDNGALECYARIPEGLSKEDQASLRAHLAELRTAPMAEGRSARYIRAYADAALATDPWPSGYADPMPTVMRLLEEIAEPLSGRGK
ncbi:MAG TPA: hypothetical protein VEN81_17840 [Planctomycetota bacterium]|nr:hypothetical protein [Planctomycetota bacterium]